MIHYRNMVRAELGAVLDWAGTEGWNPGLDDAAAFWAADPDGFFVACDAGVPVAAISVVVHSADFAFLGLYLCRPSHRGRGIGLSLWQHALAHAGNRTVGLDGVPAQQANYEASGFRHAGETVRYVGQMTVFCPEEIREALPADLPALVALEARASGWSKPAYMSTWFKTAPTRTTLLTESDGVPDGVVTVRRCLSGTKIGPLIAPNVDAALKLTRAAAAGVEGELSIDVPQQAADFAAALRAAGFTPAFQTARMYLGTAVMQPTTPILHAVTSLELG